MIKETPEVTEMVAEQESALTLAPAASGEQLVAMLVDRARSQGLRLADEGGLLQMLTSDVCSGR